MLGMLGLIAWAQMPLWEKRQAGKRGRRVNNCAVLSVVILLLGILAAGIAQFTLHYFQIPTHRFKVGGAFLVILWASASYAMLGLAQLKRRKWQAGSKRARSVLVVILLSVGAVCAVAWFTVIAPPPEIPPFLSRALNFRFTINLPWTRVRARTVDSVSIFVLKRANPSMTFSVIAAEPGLKSTLTSREVADAAKVRLMKTIEGCKPLDETALKIHDMDGLLVESGGQVNGIPTFFLQWVTVTRGFSYELTISAPASVTRTRLKDEAIALFQNFELLRTATPSLYEAVDYHSLTSGYSVKLAGTEWNRPVHDLFTHFPGAEFGIGTPPNGVFAVLPLPLGGYDPDVNLLSHAFLWRVGVESVQESVSGLKQVTHGPVHGVAFNFERSSFPGMIYRAEVLTGNGFGYMLIGLMEKLAGAERQLSDVMARVEFDPAPSQPKPESFTSRERLLISTYIREIGIEYLRNNRYAEACDYFHRAQQVEPQPEYYIREATDALMATGGFHAALAYLNAAIAYGVPENGDLLVRRAWLEAKKGETDHALATYAKAFPYHLRNDLAFNDYVQLLLRENQGERALSVLATYLSMGDSKAIRLSQAAILTARQQTGQALEILQNLDQKTPNDPQVQLAMVQTYLAAGRYPEALAGCEKLAKDGYSTALIHFLTGRCHYALKNWEAAKTALANACRQEPANPEIKALLDKVTSEHPGEQK